MSELWDDVKAYEGGDFELHPVGKFDFTVESVEEVESKTSKPMLKLKLVSSEGSVLHHALHEFADGIFEIFGRDISKWVGKSVKLDVKHENGYASVNFPMPLIPSGKVLKLICKIEPGACEVRGEPNLATLSKTKESEFVKFEFTVAEGEFYKRKIFQNITTKGVFLTSKGGKFDAGADGLSKIKAIAESVSAYNNIKISRLVDLMGKTFIGKVIVKNGQNGYSDSNEVVACLPGSLEFDAATNFKNGIEIDVESKKQPTAGKMW